jgi:hypothetical protein
MPRPKVLGDATRKMVSLPAQLAQAIEDYRFNHRVKTEAEAIRRLIEAGLTAEDKIPIRSRKLLDTTPSNETEGSGKPGSARKGHAPRAHKRGPD